MTPAPHPVVQVLTAPEVLTAATGAVAVILGLLSVLVRSQTRRLEDGLHRLGRHTDAAKTAAERATESVTNNHGTHMRDDIDEVRAGLETVLARLDTAETARQADVERQDDALATIGARVFRVETHADGLRADLRALDARITHQEERPCRTCRGSQP